MKIIIYGMHIAFDKILYNLNIKNESINGKNSHLECSFHSSNFFQNC